MRGKNVFYRFYNFHFSKGFAKSLGLIYKESVINMTRDHDST